MKLFVKDNQVVSHCKDDVESQINGCDVYYIPDDTIFWDDTGFLALADIGITKASSDQYEAMSKLNITDRDMARVVEDLIDILIDKGVITFAELPEAAQLKIKQREDYRYKVKES